MKIGVAKFDAGGTTQFKPADGNKSIVITEGRKFHLPDDYDFDYKDAIFIPEKEEKKGGKNK